MGVITKNLIEGLLKNQDILIDLIRVDQREEHQVQDHERLNRKYTPRLGSPLLAKLKSLIDIHFISSVSGITHCHYSSNAAFLKRQDRKVIVTMHGFPRPEVESKLKDKLAYKFEEWCVSSLGSTVVVTISEYCKVEIKKRFGINATVIYNGIDCNYYVPAKNKIEIKKRLGLLDKKVILFVGRLHSLKDPLTLIKSYSLITRSLNNTVLLVVGDGPMQVPISNFLLKNNLKAIMMGNRYGNDLLSLYQCADLFVMPSHGESFGLTLVEAMACGCPCIANNSGALPEILGNKDLLVEPGDIKDLSGRINYFLENPEISEMYTESNIRRVTGQFSSDRMCNDYYKLYKSVHTL